MVRGATQKDEGQSQLYASAACSADAIQMGGNEEFTSFMDSYGPEGGYKKGMGMQEKYNSWAATQYREKVSFHVHRLDQCLAD